MKEIILVGNPNCGKTTLFNALTKSKEATGNRSGVTTIVKSARTDKKYGEITITDLPGMYSLSSLGEDELRASRYLEKAIDATIIYVADATNLEKSLFLLTEVLEKRFPIVIALNMYDEVLKEEINLDIDGISRKTGLTAVPISAAKSTGIDQLIKAAKNAALKENSISFGNDKDRVKFISDICKTFVLSGKQRKVSDKIDSVICKQYIGIPLFLLIMSAIFFLSFSSLGALLSEMISNVINTFCSYIKNNLIVAKASPICIGILCDGIIGGIGAVASFLPQTVLLFILLEFLEDVGYLSRASFAADPIMRHFGLSGRAFIPIFIGMGCATPAVQSASVLNRSERTRLFFAMPFVPCSARFPVLAAICVATFDKFAWLAITAFYILGIFTALLTASRPKAKSPPLVIELPKYRAPKLRNILTCAKSKMSDLFTRTASIVTLSSVIIYVLFTLDIKFNFTNDIDKSLLCLASEKLTFILSPIGINDYRITASLISGFFAKETILSSMSILGVGTLDAKTAISVCTFSMLYTPCAATIGALNKEIGRSKTISVIIKTFLTSYVITFMLNKIFDVFM